MRAGSSAFEAHLAPEESLVAVDSGTLLEDAGRTPVSVGVTDRRLLLVDEDGGFVDVAHDTVHAIRSRPRRRATHRELGSRLLVGGGILLVVLALSGTAVMSTDVLVPILALAAVGGVVAAEYVRRAGIALDGAGVRRLGAWLRGTAADPLRGHLPRLASAVDERPVLPALALLVSLAGFAGLVVHTASSALLSLTFVAIGGIAIVDAVRRQARYLDDRGKRWRREREVEVHLIDGRTVQFRIDDGATVDRDLSRLTCRQGLATVDPEIVPR